MLKVWLAMFAALTVALGLAVGTAGTPAGAAPVTGTVQEVPAAAALTASTPAPAPTGTSVAPTADNTTTNPVNPGTGENAEQESNRLGWAPLVITAILLIVLVSVGILWWRRRHTERL